MSNLLLFPLHTEIAPVDNRLIRASAGTGKTYQLSSRFLRLLLDGAKPESILATTFTRKAAGEILDRVLWRLAEAAQDETMRAQLAAAVDRDELDRDECLEQLTRLTRHLHRLRISTLDAFFVQLARSFSLELGLPPGWQIIDEHEELALRDEAIAAVLRSGKQQHILSLVHQLVPKGEAKRGVAQILRESVDSAYHLFLQSSAGAWQALKTLAPVSQEELRPLFEELRMLELPGKSLSKARDENYQAAIYEDWPRFVQKGIAAKVVSGEITYGRQEIPACALGVYRPLIRHASAMILQSVVTQTRGAYEFLEKYHQQSEMLKQSLRLQRFDDLTQRLSRQRKTRDAAALAFRLDSDIEHLLLDEFQDTSLEQWLVLQPLAERVALDSSGRSFFCVGDVKQAIYGWRGGSAEIFDLLDEQLHDVRVDELQESRRSAPVIIDTVNRIFHQIQDHPNLSRAEHTAKRWSQEFPTHTTYRRELPGYVTLETGPESVQGQENGVLLRAADRLAAIVKQSPGFSVGVLCRRNEVVGKMIYLLQRRGVPASEEGGNALTDSAAVQLVLSLLQLADHPSDTVAAYHLAASPWAATLGLESLEGKQVVPFRQGGSLPFANSALQLSSRVRKQLIVNGFGETLQTWAESLLPFCNSRELRRLEQLVELAHGYQARQNRPRDMGYTVQRRVPFRPSAFAEFARAHRVSDPSTADTRVMTVHQSKGLQFDIVVLPDLDHRLIERHDPFVHGRSTPTSEIDLVCRYVGKDRGRSLLPAQARKLFQEQDNRKARESLCVLYVALTRAVHALHMFVPYKKRPSATAAGVLVSALAKQQSPESVVYEAGDAHWFLKLPPRRSPSQPPEQIRRLAPRLAKPAGARNRGLDSVAPSRLEGGGRLKLGEKLKPQSGTGMQYGTLIHAWFEQISWLEEGVPDKPQLIAIADGLNTSGIDVPRAIDEFHEMLSSPALRSILSRKSYAAVISENPGTPASVADFRMEVRNEQPIASRDPMGLMSGMIDRLVLMRRGGEVVAADIIDYKTDAIDVADADMLQAKVAYYQPQIAAYRRAASRMLRIDEANVICRLVFVGPRMVVPVA